MMAKGGCVLRVLFLIGMWSTVACSSGSVTAPDGLKRAYTGEWPGATSQGTAITFSVSAVNTVTSIAIGHKLQRLPRNADVLDPVAWYWRIRPVWTYAHALQPRLRLGLTRSAGLRAGHRTVHVEPISEWHGDVPQL